MDRAPDASSSRADLVYAAFYSGAVGGSVIALVFLATDGMAGRPFFTPSVLGSAAFLGQRAADVTAVSLTAAAYFTVVHFAAFACLGLLGALLFRATHARDAAPTVTTAVVLFALVQGGMLLASRTVLPGVVETLGRATVLSANVLTALAMALFLRRALSTRPADVEESEDELVEGPSLS